MQPTFSKSSLLLLCQRWAGIDIPKIDDNSEEAQYGTDFHALMAQRLEGGFAPDGTNEALVARVEQSRRVLLDWLESEGWMRPWKIEQPLGWRVASNRDDAFFEAKPCDSNHIYPYDERFFCGTADLIVLPPKPDDIAAPEPSLLVLDHKTGVDDFSSPGELHQLWTIAAVACRVYGYDSAVLAVLHAPMSGGVPTVYSTTKPVSAKRLRAYRNMIRRVWKRIGDKSLTPGPHCTDLYCPGYVHCPMRDNATALLKRPPSELSLSDVPRVWAAGHEMVRVWEDRILPELRSFIEANGDVSLGNGKRLTLVENSPRRGLSLASIDRALKAAKVDGDTKRVAGIVKLLTSLEELRCIETTTPKPSLTTRKEPGAD